jgi:hypothetical protein
MCWSILWDHTRTNAIKVRPPKELIKFSDADQDVEVIPCRSFGVTYLVALAMRPAAPID